MKHFILLLAIICVATYGCKTKQEVSQNVITELATPKGATLGKVSHQYRATGCATVVLLEQFDDSRGNLTLIPIVPLIQEMDIDGLAIYFDYRPLKVRNPDGCSVGIPAELKNISKK